MNRKKLCWPMSRDYGQKLREEINSLKRIKYLLRDELDRSRTTVINQEARITELSCMLSDSQAKLREKNKTTCFCDENWAYKEMRIKNLKDQCDSLDKKNDLLLERNEELETAAKKECEEHVVTIQALITANQRKLSTESATKTDTIRERCEYCGCRYCKDKD